MGFLKDVSANILGGIIGGLCTALIIFFFTNYYYDEVMKEFLEDWKNPIIEYIFTGEVLSEDGRPIPDAIVGFVGKNENTKTGIYGKYEMKAYFRKSEEKCTMSIYKPNFYPQEKVIQFTLEDKKNKTLEINYYELQKAN